MLSASPRQLTCAGLLFALISASCAPGRAAVSARGPAPRLPSYTEHAVTLFDDAIEPWAVGAGLQRGASESDSLLRERTQLGDCVARVRIATITSRLEGSEPSWQIRLHTLERLAGRCAGTADLTIEVHSTDPGAGVLRAFDGRLVGMTLVAFLRVFARSDDSEDGDLHFHLTGEGKDELRAVRVAALLGEVR